MKKLTVIIVAYNVEDIIGNCLISLANQSYKEFETIIINNGSRDNTLEEIENKQSLLPKVKLISNVVNIGTCAARNQAIDIANGKYIMTVDSDVILQENFISEILKCMKNQTKEVGIVGGKIMQLNRKRVIDSTGLIISNSLRFYDRGKGEVDRGQYDCKKEIFGACAAAAIYKRKVFEDIKDKNEYFDSQLYYLLEDFDIAMRARDKGWKVIFCPEAVCYHKRNGSSRKNSIRQYLTFRNRYYFLFKNENYKKLNKNIFFVFLYDSFRLPFLLFTNPYTIRGIKELIQFYIKK